MVKEIFVSLLKYYVETPALPNFWECLHQAIFIFAFFTLALQQLKYQ